jgi:hypothetical protein
VQLLHLRRAETGFVDQQTGDLLVYALEEIGIGVEHFRLAAGQREVT